MSKVFLTPLLLAALAVSCTHSPRESVSSTPHLARPRIPGCYSILPGQWERDAEINRLYRASDIPRLLQLDTTRVNVPRAPGSDSLPYYDVLILTSSNKRTVQRPFTYWQPLRIGSDTISIGTLLALGGASLKLVPSTAGFTGAIFVFTDVVTLDRRPVTATAPIELKRFDCPPG